MCAATNTTEWVVAKMWQLKSDVTVFVIVLNCWGFFWFLCLVFDVSSAR